MLDAKGVGVLISHQRAYEFQDAGIDFLGVLIDEDMTGIRNDFYLPFWKICFQSREN